MKEDITIFIEKGISTHLSLQVSQNDNIGLILNKLVSMGVISNNNYFCLNYNGNFLDESNSLSSYGISEGSTLRLIEVRRARNN